MDWTTTIFLKWTPQAAAGIISESTLPGSISHQNKRL
jgi:hypothetical protein